MIKDVNDAKLTEYLIRHSFDMKLSADYFPKDKGAWTVSCGDTHFATSKEKKYKKGTLLMKAVMLD